MERYLGTVPKNVTRVADEIGFPLLDVPGGHTWGELMESILVMLRSTPQASVPKENKTNLVRDLLTGRLNSKEELAKRGRRAGIGFGGAVCALVVSYHGGKAVPTSRFGIANNRSSDTVPDLAHATIPLTMAVPAGVIGQAKAPASTGKAYRRNLGDI